MFDVLSHDNRRLNSYINCLTWGRHETQSLGVYIIYNYIILLHYYVPNCSKTWSKIYFSIIPTQILAKLLSHHAKLIYPAVND